MTDETGRGDQRRTTWRVSIRGVFAGLAALTVLFGCDGEGQPGDMAVACGSDDQCDDGVYCNGRERCDVGGPAANALGCVAGLSPCLAGQSCDEESDTCEALCEVTEDADGDGSRAIACGGEDCDDSNAAAFPGNVEVCDAEGVDEDCDPDTLGGRDVDLDGYEDAACCNGEVCGTDCADRMAQINPGVAEVCDLVDQDCDGNVDEGVQANGFLDRDGDRHGDPLSPRLACSFQADIAPGMEDCEDSEGTRHGQMLELCDGIDNDCDESIDEGRFSVTWYEDIDGDGFGDPEGNAMASCEPVAGFSTLPFDCDDGTADRSPIADERCNAQDDDCDGRRDYQIAAGDTEDDDGDGVADARCPGGGGTDCDDRDPFTAPGMPELCDGFDNDCDGSVDEDAATVFWYVDEDRDGYGDESAERTSSCERVAGRARRGGDCDDGDGGRRPGMAEVCDGVDNDCDGVVDEGASLVATYDDIDGDGFGAGAPVYGCDASGARTTVPGDCNDGDSSVAPGADEHCNDVDDDCDGSTDEEPAGALDCSTDVPNATAACSAGICTVGACVAGFDDCDGSAISGCEAELATDPQHCGACGASCGLGDSCTASACDDRPIDSIAVSSTTVCVARGGQVYCWGGSVSYSGPLGTGLGIRELEEPGIPVLGISDAVSVHAVNTDSFCAHRAGGEVVCWGRNQFGQLGVGDRTVRDQPTPLGGGPATYASLHAHRSVCGIEASGALWCWGFSTSSVGADLPVQMTDGAGAPIMDAIDVFPAGALQDTCIVRELGGGTIWRADSSGQFSTQIGTLSGAVAVVGRSNSIGGANHLCALLTDGRVTCRGPTNEYGELGNGTFLPQVGWAEVVGISDAVGLESASRGACVIRAGGTVACWGWNQGQFANAALAGADQPTPISLPGLTAVTELESAWGSPYCAFANGRLVCWGYNSDGLILDGDPSTSIRDSPAAIVPFQ